MFRTEFAKFIIQTRRSLYSVHCRVSYYQLPSRYLLVGCRVLEIFNGEDRIDSAWLDDRGYSELLELRMITLLQETFEKWMQSRDRSQNRSSCDDATAN